MLTKVLRSKNKLSLKRKARVRSKINGTLIRPRISIFKSNRYFYAQAINDNDGSTLYSINTKQLNLSKNKSGIYKMGLVFAESLKKKNIQNVVFDRNRYLYHGVVASFADSLRENGLIL